VMCTWSPGRGSTPGAYTALTTHHAASRVRQQPEQCDRRALPALGMRHLVDWVSAHPHLPFAAVLPYLQHSVWTGAGSPMTRALPARPAPGGAPRREAADQRHHRDVQVRRGAVLPRQTLSQVIGERVRIPRPLRDTIARPVGSGIPDSTTTQLLSTSSCERIMVSPHLVG
jgi:hypothetical protein